MAAARAELVWAGPGPVRGPFRGPEGTSGFGGAGTLGTIGAGPVAAKMKERYSQVLKLLDMSSDARDYRPVCL